MKNSAYLLSLFILLFACGTENVTSSPVNYLEEVKALETPDQQRIFLEQIYTDDQEVREKLPNVIQEFGYDSKEHKAILERMIELEEVHLAKIEAFLELYGHPALVMHGNEGTRTPWIVIHHAMGDAAPRIHNFKYLYEAWKSRDLSGKRFTLYLNRTYDKQFGHRMEIKGAFREEFEMDTLIRSLNLQQIREEVDKAFEDLGKRSR